MEINEKKPIPSEVFNVVAYGSEYNRGARLCVGLARYNLHYKSRSFMPDYKKVICYKETLSKAFKSNEYIDNKYILSSENIPFSEVPASIPSDWHVWNEY